MYGFQLTTAGMTRDGENIEVRRSQCEGDVYKARSYLISAALDHHRP